MRKPVVLRTLALSVALAMGLAACQGREPGADDPKRRLSDYIAKTFAVKDPAERKELLGFLTGDARTRLEAWSDEQFREAFIENKREFLKLIFREVKTVGEREVGITYEVIYLQTQGNTKTKVTHKKLAQLVRATPQEPWQVTSVKNLAELIEYQNELSLP